MLKNYIMITKLACIVNIIFIFEAQGQMMVYKFQPLTIIRMRKLRATPLMSFISDQILLNLTKKTEEET